MPNAVIRFEPYSRDNWEEAVQLSVRDDQKAFVPSVVESLAVAYIKPWDEALDPYVIYADDQMVGSFYLSYTPDGTDNYWVGGLLIDHRYQGQGLGKAAMLKIIDFVPSIHPNCREIKLTVEKDNAIARTLYRGLGFEDTGQPNRDGEIIYRLHLAH